MGNLCSKSKKKYSKSTEIEKENEIALFSYTSKPDKEFLKLETKYNFFQDISFSDYLYSLTNFEMSNATVQDDYSNKPSCYNHKDSFFNVPMSCEFFQSFLENKILKHPNLYAKAANNELLTSKFKESYLYVYKSLESKLKQNDKNNGLEDIDERIKKSHCMIFGLLFCQGTNISKIRFLFSLFEDNNLLKPTEELKEFLLSMFIMSSYCMLYASNTLGINNPDVPQLDKGIMKNILDTCELKDSVHLVDVAIQKMFGNTSELSYDSFKYLFNKDKDSLGWLISVKGIRHAIEENNV